LHWHGRWAGRAPCARARPGAHCAARAAQVVAKLFNIVEPDVALFGRKDYQQWRVLTRMARDLDFAVEVVGLPLVREPDGLAMSRRALLGRGPHHALHGPGGSMRGGGARGPRAGAARAPCPPLALGCAWPGMAAAAGRGRRSSSVIFECDS
jgi:hypothetical protein